MTLIKNRSDGLPDGPDKYPNSCCEYVFFRHSKLLRAQAFLRQREFILQGDIERLGDSREGEQARAKLEEVERVLIFFTTDVGKQERTSGGEYEQAS